MGEGKTSAVTSTHQVGALIERALVAAAKARAAPAVLDCLLDALRKLEDDEELSRATDELNGDAHAAR